LILTGHFEGSFENFDAEFSFLLFSRLTWLCAAVNWRNALINLDRLFRDKGEFPPLLVVGCLK
jgi:hypothetical protein